MSNQTCEHCKGVGHLGFFFRVPNSDEIFYPKCYYCLGGILPTCISCGNHFYIYKNDYTARYCYKCSKKIKKIHIDL